MPDAASELFGQFNPQLHFEKPLESNEKGWFLIAEQTVPSTLAAFWQTATQWTTEPQHVIPPIEKAEILEESPQKVRRRLIPKRKAKDAPLEEGVEYCRTEEGCPTNRVIYRPHEKVENLPFYYPKVEAYSLVYMPDQNSQESGLLRLELASNDPILDTKMQYALQTVLHKLFKWCIQARIGYKKKAHHDVLVDKDTYTQLYQRLKAKYAGDLIRNWSEKTDPKKFVFEDIAIASYLICLWKESRPTFVDLGCGNGLLTYLLTSEGYEGYGIDIADRKIWTQLKGDRTDLLRVEALHPSSAVYPEADWLLGNHADELVPWIPIIATKSKSNFMVIPCCLYGLDGTKKLVLKPAAGEGKYEAYTSYVKSIATQCGFEPEQDYLRIPSTKNITIVGRNRRDEPVDLSALETAGASFVPRLSDREKEEQRRRKIRKLA